MLSMLFMTTIPRIIRTDFNGSASNLKPTVSATTMILLWNVSLLSMRQKKTAIIGTDLKVCFEFETNVFCSNHFLIAKRLNVVKDNQSLGSSVLIWRGLLRSWNQRFLQQPFSDGETSQCCSWQPEHRIISADLKKSVTIPKPTISAATIFLL